MRILCMSPFLPYPPYNGGRTRLLHFIDSLVQRHKVTLVCLKKSDEKLDLDWYTKRDIELVVHTRLSPFSIRGAYQSIKTGSVYAGIHYSEDLKETVKALLNTHNFDLVHAVCSFILRNLPSPLNIPLIVEEPNLQSVVLRQHSRLTKNRILRQICLREAAKLETIELQGVRRANQYICSSPSDKRVLQGFGYCNTVKIVPNGVDTDYYSFQSIPKASYPLLIFLANFNYFPNIDAIKFFIKDIFPAICLKIPNVKLRIIGYHADSKLSQLQSNDIEVSGYKADIRADLTQGWISICPLRSGSGSRIKILESMAVGTSVVSSSIGCAGLPVENGKDSVIAENSDMVDSIVTLIRNPHLREQISLNARHLVETQMTWRQSVAILEAIYLQAWQSMIMDKPALQKVSLLPSKSK